MDELFNIRYKDAEIKVSLTSNLVSNRLTRSSLRRNFKHYQDITGNCVSVQMSTDGSVINLCFYEGTQRLRIIKLILVEKIWYISSARMVHSSVATTFSLIETLPPFFLTAKLISDELLAL